MQNITYITDEQGVEHAIIDHGNEQFTSMTKEEYDRQQAALSTPIVSSDADQLQRLASI